MAAVAVGTALSREVADSTAFAQAPVVQAPSTAQAAGEMSKFLPGFTVSKVKTSGTTIHAVKGGQGPPLLLLHGAPMSHITWRFIGPQLAKQYTVVAPDLRGYGDSGKMPDTADHSNYSKRAMALDHPGAVTKLAVLDILPTYYLYTHVTLEFVNAYFHWFNYLRPAPGPENELKAQADGRRGQPMSDVQAEYFRTTSTMENIHAMCEDYRAAASIDLKHDEADLNKKVSCPLLTLWGERGPMGRLYDVLAVWRTRGNKVNGKGLPGGHNLQEEEPVWNQVLTELTGFLKA